MKKVITIDGPAGSGKSTLAENLQQALPDFVLVDTGAYFRWATYLCLQAGLDLTKRRAVYNFVKNKMELEFVSDRRARNMRIYQGGKLINKLIFNSPEVSRQTGEIPQHYLMRNLIKKKLRQLAQRENIIIAGRDTGTYTFPDAWLKFFLTANFTARVERKHRDYARKQKIKLDETREIMRVREFKEEKQKDSPLKQPAGAIVIDNTNIKAEETAKLAMKAINLKLKANS